MKKMRSLIILILLNTALVYSQGIDFGNFSERTSDATRINNPVLQKSRDRADDALDKLEGLIPMRFFNALDRKPIQGASIEIPNIGTYITNIEGKIVFPKISDGNYTLIFSKEGFITTPIEFRVLLGRVDMNWYSVSPGFSDKDFRIVLEWGEKPADLDLHFVKTGGSGDYHISYWNMRKVEDGSAILDRDDTSGYGPETITIEKTDIRAAYICYVHDYTNRNNISSTQMTQGGTVIRVYSLNRLMYTFHVPTEGKGTKWEVFKIEQGVIVPINTVTAR